MSFWTHQIRVHHAGGDANYYAVSQKGRLSERLIGVGEAEGLVLAVRGNREAGWHLNFWDPGEVKRRAPAEVAPEDRRYRVVVWVQNVDLDLHPTLVEPERLISEWTDYSWTPRWGDPGLVMTCERLAALVNGARRYRKEDARG